MACYKTHNITASITIGILTIIVMPYFQFNDLLFLFIIGVLSTSIPDLDSNTSIPLKNSYKILSIFIPFLLLYVAIHRLNLDQYILTYTNNTTIIYFITYIISFFIFYILFHLFERLTIHRGILHSIPISIFSALVVAYILKQYHFSNMLIAFSMLFIFVGVNTHLILDEIWSIIRLKHSFGSAFKLYSSHNISGSIILYILIILLYNQLDIDIFDTLLQN